MTIVEDGAAERSATARRGHGTWRSPLTPGAVAAAAGGSSWPAVVGPETWWCASHTPSGTVKLLRSASPGEAPSDVLGGDWKVGNGAIGYGGRPYLAVPGAVEHLVVFTNSPDGRLYAARVAVLDDARPSEPAPIALTPPDPEGLETNYADPILGPGGDEVWCVREVIRGGVSTDVSRAVVAIPLSGAASGDGSEIRVVASTHDFYSGIRLSPDGTRLAWVGWNHPDMPWDSSSLMVARLIDGRAVDTVRVLGGDGVSVPQAEWADADSLYALADPDGWWNLHRVTLGGAVGGGGSADVECVLPRESEFGHAIWRVGATSFAVTDAGVVLRHGVGDQRVGLWDPRTGELSDLVGAGDGGAGGDLTEFAVGCAFGATPGGATPGGAAPGVAPGASSVAVIGAGPGERGHALRIDAAARRVSRCAPAVDDGFGPWHARPERRTVPGGAAGRAASENNRPIHFVYYPPTNPVDRAPEGELPPLIIDVHGGPTSTTGNSRSLTFSLFCSLGFAVASVDYGGSTGYGRAYRDLLRHTWGTTDVEDCVAVARALADEGLADPARTAIRGGSAGGWTTLAALAHTDVFCCGVVYYPISDPLTWLGAETHDFESRYVESLVGRMPEDEERLRRVSPLGHAAEITAPFIMLQGLDDTICRPDQARRAVAAVEQAHGPGLCRTFLEFPGEGHGFRRPGSIAASLEAELCLFNAVMVLP